MPVIKSAKKQMRSSARKRVMNVSRRKAVKDAVREVQNGATPEKVRVAFKALDKATKRGIVHRNKAARLKSRLSRKVSA